MPLSELQAIAARLAELAREDDYQRLDIAIESLVHLPLSPLRFAYACVWAYALLGDGSVEAIRLQRAIGRAVEREP